MKDALAIGEKRVKVVFVFGLIVVMVGAYFVGGNKGMGAGMLGAGFALMITALNQAFGWESQKLQTEYDEEIKALLTEIRDKDCCSKK